MTSDNDRYIVQELAWYKTELRWAIYDIMEREHIKDTRHYKKSSRIWKDTEDNARHHASLLNARYHRTGVRAADTDANRLHLSQAIHFAHVARVKKIEATSFVSTFVKCGNCGSMYQGQHDCKE